MNIKDQEKIFTDFFNLMKDNIRKKLPIYKDSWTYCDIQHLYARLHNKYEEYNLTKNPHKLISIANLSMFIHLREEGYFE